MALTHMFFTFCVSYFILVMFERVYKEDMEVQTECNQKWKSISSLVSKLSFSKN